MIAYCKGHTVSADVAFSSKGKKMDSFALDCCINRLLNSKRYTAT